jgi:hypothetical protein
VTASTLGDFFEGLVVRHQEQVQRGEHDEQCEFHPGQYLCHCSKRRREATGHAELPGRLKVRKTRRDGWSAYCPRCEGEMWCDPDGFECRTCRVAWDSEGTGPWFTDEYGKIRPRPNQ